MTEQQRQFDAAEYAKELRMSDDDRPEGCSECSRKDERIEDIEESLRDVLDAITFYKEDIEGRINEIRQVLKSK